jgi:FkbM family methyltransferase
MNVFSRSINRILRKLEKKQNPNNITYETAIKWFGRREDIYEDLLEAVIPYVDREGTIIDVGANIGYFSLLLMKKIDFLGSAYLFEPVPNLANLCKTNFKDKPYKVQVFNFGLSNEDGEFEIFTDRDGNIGWNTLIAGKATANMEKIKVKTKKFDSVGIEARPSFIKVDVEGTEYKVFQGMLNSMKTWKPLPVILCEVGWGQSHPNWKEELLVFGELGKLGYDFYDLKKLKIDMAGLKKTTDVICIPRKG